MNISLTQSQKPAAALVLLTLLVQAVFLAAAAIGSDWNAKVHEPDSQNYLQLADALASHGRFTSDGLPNLTRTPGYPLLLVPGAVAARTTAWALLIQWFIKGWTAWLLFQVALSVWQRPRVAAVATLIYALEPMSQLYAGKVLTETPFTAAMLLCTLMLLRYLSCNHWRYLFVAGLALAAATWIRPISFYLAAPLTVLIAVRGYQQGLRWKSLLGHAAVFLLLAQGPPAAWQIRNAVQTGYTGFCAIADVNLYFYQGAAVWATEQGKTLEEVQQQLGYLDDAAYFRAHPDQTSWSQSRRFKFYRDQGLSAIKRHPLAYARIHGQGILDTLLSPGNESFLEYLTGNKTSAAPAPQGRQTRLQRIIRLLWERPGEFAIRATLRLFLIGMLALTTVGLLLQGSRGQRSHWLLLAVIFGYLLFLSGGPVGYHRFRVPITPFLCLWGAAGTVWLVERMPRRSTNGARKEAKID